MSYQPGVPPRARPPSPAALPRLVTPGLPDDLPTHLAHYGPVPRGAPAELIASVERSGLTGRGGAAFPAGRKMRAVTGAAGRGGRLGRDPGGPVVIANGVESEPASSKDTILLGRAPHLVLDGIEAAARAVGAGDAFLCVHQSRRDLARTLTAAVADRRHSGLSSISVAVVGIPDGYVTSEETSLVNYLNGGPPVPLAVPPRPAQRGVGGRPTLVNNVETLAHIALIARYGPGWFAAIGTRQAPGSALITVGGAVRRPGVYEIALGTRLGDLIDLAGGLASPAQAVLAGGYFGAWLPYPAAAGIAVSDPDLRAAGAGLGAGVVLALPETACGLAETARVAGYLAAQSAGQCGPCVNGLPVLARALRDVARGPADEALAALGYFMPFVEGRGACHFPDGVVRLIASAVRVFGEDLRQHRAAGPCAGTRHAPVLPLPRQDRGGRAGRPGRTAPRAGSGSW